MRGSVKKDTARGTWTVVIDNGTDPTTGKRRQLRRRGFKTEKAAERELGQLMKPAQDGAHVEPSRQTVRMFLEDWIATLPGTVAPTTERWYALLVRSYVMPHIGAVPLRAVDAGTLHGLYAALRSAGSRKTDADGNAKPLSERTVRAVHVALHRAFDQGVKWRRLAANPADDVTAPRQRSTTEWQGWNADELRRFLARVANDRLYGLWYLAAMTGLRRGELCALRWEDFDLETGTMAVRRAMVLTVEHKLVEGPPKSGRGRAVALDPTTVVELRAHRKRQLEERLAWGQAWTDSGAAFTREDGSQLHPDFLSNVFDRLVGATGLPRVTIHGLRHTHATLALKAGIHPKVVQERLGHASIRITLDLYSHVSPGMQEEAAAKVAALVVGDFVTNP